MIQMPVKFYTSVDQNLSLFGSISFKLGKLPNTIELAWVAKTLDTTIQWTEIYLLDSMIYLLNNWDRMKICLLLFIKSWKKQCERVYSVSYCHTRQTMNIEDTVILLQIVNVMVSPGTHLVKNHESKSRTKKSQFKKESKIENAWALM